MPDGGPELTLITPGRVGRGAGGRPPRAGVGLTTAVILHPRTPVPSPRRGRTRPHRTGAGLTGDKAAITADRLALIAPGSDLSASARGCGSDPLVLRLVPALTWSARSPGNPRGRTSARGTSSRVTRRSRGPGYVLANRAASLAPFPDAAARPPRELPSRRPRDRAAGEVRDGVRVPDRDPPGCSPVPAAHPTSRPSFVSSTAAIPRQGQGIGEVGAAYR